MLFLFHCFLVCASCEFGEEIIDSLYQVICSDLTGRLVVGLLEHDSLESTRAVEKLSPALEKDVGNTIGYVLTEEKKWEMKREARAMSDM